jgi:hypothetical protein
MNGGYAHLGSAYAGRFYDGPHKFDQVMQHDSANWLAVQLR